MKIAITTGGTDLSAPIDPRFGRAANFLVYDLESGTAEIHENSVNLHAEQGAGIQAALNITNLGVRAVLTGHCGPKAFRVLKASGVLVYKTDAPDVASAITLFRENGLTELKEADVEGHWA